jgi:hypothetical protein
MCRHYARPLLLIEFDPDRQFGLQSASELGEDIDPKNVISRLVLLALHFPKLRCVGRDRNGTLVMRPKSSRAAGSRQRRSCGLATREPQLATLVAGCCGLAARMRPLTCSLR